MGLKLDVGHILSEMFYVNTILNVQYLFSAIFMYTEYQYPQIFVFL